MVVCKYEISKQKIMPERTKITPAVPKLVKKERPGADPNTVDYDIHLGGEEVGNVKLGYDEELSWAASEQGRLALKPTTTIDVGILKVADERRGQGIATDVVSQIPGLEAPSGDVPQVGSVILTTSALSPAGAGLVNALGAQADVFVDQSHRTLQLKSPPNKTHNGTA